MAVRSFAPKRTPKLIVLTLKMSGSLESRPVEQLLSREALLLSGWKLGEMLSHFVMEGTFCHAVVHYAERLSRPEWRRDGWKSPLMLWKVFTKG
jgi:hypothetical protein